MSFATPRSSRLPAPAAPLPVADAAPIGNQVLERLPLRDRRRLQAICEPVDLVQAQVLLEPGKVGRHAYLPVDATISLSAVIDDGRSLEVAQVGREGMLGAEVRLGMLRAPLRAMVLGPGRAWRVGLPAFRRELRRSPALGAALDRQLAVLIAQLAVTPACLHFHLVGPRLAGWLLATDRRSGGARFHVTHELLASLLGVRRVGITVAAGALQRQGLISYHRGDVAVLDRAGLQALACRCQSGGPPAVAAAAGD